MRELLLAFILALVVGSIINGMQQPPTEDNHDTSSISSPGTGKSDYPDFDAMVNVDSNNFDQTVLRSSQPVLINCYAPDNLSCEQMIPLVAAVGKAHVETLTIVKLNVMDNALLCHRYQIDNIPSFLLFNEGKLVNRLKGVVAQERLESMVSGSLQELVGKTD